MEQNEVHDLARQIKRSFRLFMNGETSHSMREKGVEYGVNWGIELHRLRTMAAEYPKSRALAEELWQSKVRECKIMATLLMPAGEMTLEQAGAWAATLPSVELAELCALNVFQNIAGAEALAYEWIAGTDTLSAICGFHLLSRLLVKGHVPDREQSERFAEALVVALQQDHFALRRAAYNCALRFMETGENSARSLQERLEKQNLDIF